MVQLDNMTVRKAHFSDEFRKSLITYLVTLVIEHPNEEYKVEKGRWIVDSEGETVMEVEI